MPAGRPPKFKNAKDMQTAIDYYFAQLEEDCPTISGIALALDMSTQALRDYQKKDEFLATIRKAKQRVEIEWERRLLSPGSGPIFWLKNNAGWRDKTETDNTHHVEVSEIERKIIDDTDD